MAEKVNQLVLGKNIDKKRADFLTDRNREMSPIEIGQLHTDLSDILGKDASEEDKKLISDYITSLAEYQVLRGAQTLKERDEYGREMADLESQYGKIDVNGNVTAAETKDGKQVYITSSKNPVTGEFGAVDMKTGKHLTLRETDIKEEKQEDGSMKKLSRTLPTNDFLEERVIEKKSLAEQERMSIEKAQQIAEIAELLPERLNLGTDGNPIMMPVKEKSNNGVIVVDEEGNEKLLSWDEVGRIMGMPIKVATDQELLDAEIETVAAGRAANRAKYSSTKESQQKVEGELSEIAQEVESLNPAPEAAYTNEAGEVDEVSFWENDPEGWCDWNDRQKQDNGIDSRKQIEQGIAALSRKSEEAVKAMKTDNPVQRKQAENALNAAQDKIRRLQAIEEKYEQANAEKEDVRAEKILQLRERANYWRKKFGLDSTKLRVYESIDEVTDEGAKRAIAKGKTPGWASTFSKATAHAALYLPMIDSIEELDETVMHEVVTHYGLATWLGKQEYNDLMDKVWDMMSDNSRATFYNYYGVVNKTGDARRRAAAEEYVAHVAEKIDAENATAGERRFWQRIIDAIIDFFSGDKARLRSATIAKAVKDSYNVLVNKAAAAEMQKAQANTETVNNTAIQEAENAKAEAPESVTNISEAAQNDSGFMPSIQTEGYVVDMIRGYVKTKEGKKAGWTEDKIETIIEETQSLINAIHNASTGNEFYDEFAKKDPTIRVDWRDGMPKPIVTWTRANIEYKYDMSADLLCINNEGLEEVLSSDQMVSLMEMFEVAKVDAEKEFKNIKGKKKPLKVDIRFTSEDYLELYNTLKDLGFVVPCKGCFDAAGRFKMLPSVAQKFAEVVNAVIDERNTNPEAFDAIVKSKAGASATIEGLPTSASNKLDAIRVAVAGDKLTEHVKWSQLMSADGQTKMLSDWGGVFRAWQRTGAGRPKDKLLPEPYYGDIVSSHTTIIGKYGEKTPSFRDIDVNQGTGLRRNSHSEFRPVLAVDEIQFMRDAFIKGLTVFKYMKELDDVRLFGKLGVKYNMSYFPAFVPGTNAAGLDVNGNYVASEESVGAREFPYVGEDGKTHYDGNKGMLEAQKYVNKDVSMSSVVFSIPHLIKCLTDVPTASDMRGIWGSLIPFHSSGATSGSLAAQGLGKARANGVGHGFEEAMTRYNEGVTNFEDVQNDRFDKGWVIIEGKKAGTAVEEGHKLEFANGTHYYNKERGIHLFKSSYILDSELPEGALNEDGTLNLSAEEKKAVEHKYSIDYNDKVRELKGPAAYQDAADYYLQFLPSIGLKPRFDFEVDETTFLQMCEDANVDPMHPKLGWKGKGNGWNPIDSEAYYSLFCDYGMTDPTTGEWAPHNPVGIMNENGEREFRMPENTVEIVKEGLERYSNIRRAEQAKIDTAIREFAQRSVAKGRVSQEAVDSVLGKEDDIMLKTEISPRTSITPEMDAEYMAAVEAGDMEAAQGMVLEAARLAMPNTKVVDENGNPKVVYHGTGSEFYAFRNTNDSNELGAGYYFSDSYEMAERYATDETLADNRFRAEDLAFEIFTEEMGHSEEEYDYVNEETEDDYNEAYYQAVERLFGNGHVKSVFLNIENPFIVGSRSEDLPYRSLWQQTNEAHRVNDGIIDPEFTLRHETLSGNQYVAFKPSQIKSADPVTYDDAGNVIPLSERFNEEKEDIRFKTRTDSQREKLFADAKAEFGVTNNLNVAGYMLPDGSLLDLSEVNNGGPAGVRTRDHREIASVMDDREYDSQTEYITDFLNEGAIRLMPESDAINLSVAPSAEQREKLLDYFYKKNGYIILEIDGPNGNSAAYVEYNKGTSPYRIMRDIDNYFNEGIVPEQQNLMFKTRASNQSSEDFCLDCMRDYVRKYGYVTIIKVEPVNEATAKKYGYTLDELKELSGLYDKRIVVIFAKDDITDSDEVESTIFHESIHHLAKRYDSLVSTGEIFWKMAERNEELAIIRDYVEKNYSNSPIEEKYEEMLCYSMEFYAGTTGLEFIIGLMRGQGKKDIELILNKTNYGRSEQTEAVRQDTTPREDGADNDRQNGGEGEGASDEAGEAQQGDVLFKTTITPEVRREMDVISAQAIVNGNYMKAPNGKDSKLTPEQWAMVRTKNFLNWAGDWINDPENTAVVLDVETGEPLVLYHGTPRAGFAVFKSGWFTTSKEDAISYSGDRKGRMFDPNEKYEPETLTAGDFRLGYMTFDSEEDRAAFLAEHPTAESAMSESEYENARIQAEDEEYDTLTERKPELQKIWDAYREYERDHFVDTTIGEILNSPDAYTEDDLRRAVLAYDSNAVFDSIDELETTEERKSALVESLNYMNGDAKENGAEGILDMVVATRVPRNGEGIKHNDLGNRTYEVYARIERPYEIDANGRGSEFESGDIYQSVKDALADEQYDGVIIRNWRVGRHQQLGDVVVPKYGGNQVKLTSNENPTESEDIRFKTRTASAPTKTQDVYKLMRLGADGKLYPLFIGSAEPIELGTWYDAESPNLGDLTKLASGVHLVNNETGEAMTLDEFKAQHPEITIKGKRPNVDAINWATENGARWIEIEDKTTAQRRYEGESRSYYNLGINGSGQVGQFAMRPGWHAGSLPTMRQIGKGKDKNLRDDSFVWVKGRIPADVDYQSEADANPDKDIPTHIPTDGFYMKATNANAKASQADKMGWYVAGSFIADEIISDAEARRVIDSWNAEHPDAKVEYDYPRESGREFDPERGGLVEKENIMFKTTHERALRGLVTLESSGASFDAVQQIIKNRLASIQKQVAKLNKLPDSEHVQKRIAALQEEFEIAERQELMLNETASKLIDETLVEPDYESALSDMTPRNADEAIAQALTMSVDAATRKKVGIMLAPESLANELGWSKDDWKGLSYIVSDKGISIDRLAEMLGEDSELEHIFSGMDTMDIKDAIIDFLMGMMTYADIRDYTKNARMKEAKDEAEAINAQILSKSESTRNGLSVEEYNSWMIEADRKDRRDELNTVSALAADINEVAEQITDSTKDKADAAKATLMDKIRSIDKAIATLRSIMSVQKEYDKGTVKAIVDVANELLTSGALDGLTRGKVKKLLSIINGGAGRENMTITANRLIDLVIDNRLSFLGGLVDKFMKARIKKVNSSGVEIRGEVDAETQKVMDAFRRGMKMTETELEDAILAEMDKMSSPSETIRDNAAYELSGLQFAKRYNNEVRASVAEEAALLQEIKDTKEAHKTGLGFDSDEEHRTWEDAVRHSVRENKMERISALQKLVEDLSKIYTGGVENAKLLKQEDQARIQQIQHYANSDMQGMPASEHEIPNKALWNNSLTRFFLAPLATFDQMLRQFGRLSPSGEGYLWNHFMRKWLTSTEKEYKGVQAAHDVLDSQARAMFGGKVRRWSDLFAMSRKTSPIKAKFWDGGEMKEHVMTVGNLLYIYMVNKMTDGKTKLRKMGISEQDVVDIAASIDPQLIALADWIQETFLPGIRDKYNAVHEKLFGAPMAAIENYFPLKVNPRARTREVDTGVAETEAKPSTITGSIIKRTRNSLALDVMNVDAIDLVLEHIQQMGHWAAFAEFNQDLNALLSYRKFRTRVENMSGIYGSGTKAWQAFRHAAEMAAGVYQPASQKSTLDKAAVNIAKGVTGAKISFRVYTALKQLLSMPAFISDARIDILAKNLATPWVAWNWCMENLPLFEKRWKSRQAGDSRLMATESDWSVWKNNIVETAGRLGMSPNAFVDAFTVAVGARSIYETRKKQYLETGYSESAAEERAKQDATILFNESQQSNESAFLATVQVDRTVASVMFTVFRNSSMGYQRMYADAIRNLKHKLTKGNKAQSIEFIKKQLIRDGIEDSQAERAAERIYGRSFFKDAMRVATFGFVAQFAWNLGAYLPYLLVGDDDDEKKSMIKDAVIHGLIGGPVEGLSAGSIISEVGNMIAQGGDFKNYNPTLLPIVSDAKKVIQMFNYDEVAAVNEVFNLLIQAGLGVNPQTLTDAGVAIYDACNGDLELSKEVTLALMRILQAPQSQVDKMLADEINFKEDRGLDMTISEFAERYAKYKVLRGAPATGWMYGDEKEKEREDKYIARFLKDAEEYKRTRGNEEAKKYYEYLDTEYKEVTETLNELKSNIKKEAMQGNEVNSLEYAKLLTEFTESDIFKRYTQFGSKAKAIEKMRDKMKKVDSYTRTSIEDAMLDLRRQMVEEMDAASQAKD